MMEINIKYKLKELEGKWLLFNVGCENCIDEFDTREVAFEYVRGIASDGDVMDVYDGRGLVWRTFYGAGYDIIICSEDIERINEIFKNDGSTLDYKEIGLFSPK